MLCDYLTIRVERRYLNNRILRNSKLWFGVINGFPKKPLAVTTAKQFEQYVKINRKRMNLRHDIRSSDDDWVLWDRRLA